MGRRNSLVQDLALLWLGKSALEALRTAPAYQASKEDAQARRPRDVHATCACA